MGDKVASLEEACALVPPGASVAMSAGGVEQAPMALLRELLRRGVGDLHLVGVTGGGLNFDLLIGAGAVRSVELCHCTLGAFGGAPHFQRRFKEGSLRTLDNT